MKQQIASVIALLLASSTQGVSLGQMNTNFEAEQNKPGDSSNVDIDPESFAEASTNARIETDLEIAEGKSTENQNELWKKHFQSSEFYKNYQSHLQHRGEMTHIRNLNNQALSQIKGDYKNLQNKYNNLSQQAKTNWELGKKLSQQVPGGEKLFADQGPVSYENILLAEVVGDEEETQAPKKVENILETVEESNSSLVLDKDPSNPFNQKDKVEKDKISAQIEDGAPAEEKEKWFMKDMPSAPAAQQQTFEVEAQPVAVVKQAKVITPPAAKVVVKSAPVEDGDAEPVEPAVVQVANQERQAPVQAAQPVSQVQTSAPASEPMASAILETVDAPVSHELLRIGEKPEEAPQDEANIQLRGLPHSETTSATVTTRPWSVTVIKTVNPPITGPAGSTIVSESAHPIDDSPVLEPLDPAEMPVVHHDHIYNHHPEERISCSELNLGYQL